MILKVMLLHSVQKWMEMVCGEAEGKEAQVYVLWSKLFMEQNN
jgi:hypothetical protein